MTLWFGLALMTAAAIFAVLWPLARKFSRPNSGSDIAVYRDQLEEVRRDRAAGLIGAQEAAAAETEVSRRLLAAAGAKTASMGSTPARQRAAAVAALALLPAGAAGIYLALGSPMLPDQPLAPRLAQSPGGQSVDNLVAQVEAHLERRPDDGRGWEVIAPVYMRIGRFDDAVKARSNALRLNGETADREAALGEALVFAANGVVTADAKAAFEKALAIDANHVQGRYFLGVAAEQDGDQNQAAAIWSAMLANAPADARWAQFVRRALDRLTGNAAQVEASGRPAGPSQEQIASASQLGDEQRNVMIRGMVERLAQRLAQSGSDPEGWGRLVRSYIVLGDREKARAAESDARRALAGDPAQLQRFENLLKTISSDRVAGSPAQAAGSGGPVGPGEEQIAAASKLDAEQRNVMIRGMVERLAQRLAHSGSDPEGWGRLVRSYMVLGDREKARAAASDARRALAGDADQLRRFEEMMKELGLEG
jgi:cytochrome c-type biogenesis protein CcmH